MCARGIGREKKKKSPSSSGGEMEGSKEEGKADSYAKGLEQR